MQPKSRRCQHRLLSVTPVKRPRRGPPTGSASSRRRRRLPCLPGLRLEGNQRRFEVFHSTLSRSCPNRTVEQRAFTALGGDCELFGIAWARPRSKRRGLDPRDARPSDALFETSELSRLNAAAERGFEVSAELGALLRESLQAYELSAGLVHRGDAARLLAAATRATSPSADADPPPHAPAPAARSCSS